MDRNILNKHFNKNYNEIDGLNKLNNLNFSYNNTTNMLDVNYFTCYYNSKQFNPYNHSILDGTKIKKKSKNPFFRMNIHYITMSDNNNEIMYKKLNNDWTFYLHLHDTKEWNFESYIKILTFDALYSLHSCLSPDIFILYFDYQLQLYNHFQKY